MSRPGDLRPARTIEAINSYVAEHNVTGVKCCMARGKGRILVASRDFVPGDVLLLEPPLHTVREEPGIAIFEALRELCSHWEDGEDSLQWYWYGLRSLTAAEFGGMEVPWQPLEQEQRDRLLLLHEGGPGNSRPSRRTVSVARQLVPNLQDAGVLERCMQVWKLNSFDCCEESQNLTGAALYFLPSFMSHSCLPSAVWHIDGADNYVLRARRNITCGDEVTVTYLDECALLDHSAVRRSDLFESKEFWCSCERCSAAQDQSRGFRCPACGQGAVFARAAGFRSMQDGYDLDSGSDEDRASSAPAHSMRALVGVACDLCGHALTEAEALELAEAECRIQAKIQHWRKHGKDFELQPSDVLGAEEEVAQGPLMQHSVVNRIRKFLAKHYRLKGRVGHEKELLHLRACIEFSACVYPFHNAARAWSLEAFADALLSAAPHSGSSHQDQIEEALQAYRKALSILEVMFGRGQEYVNDVESKIKHAMNECQKE